jgi:hypothetical protein
MRFRTERTTSPRSEREETAAINARIYLKANADHMRGWLAAHPLATSEQARIVGVLQTLSRRLPEESPGIDGEYGFLLGQSHKARSKDTRCSTCFWAPRRVLRWGLSTKVRASCRVSRPSLVPWQRRLSGRPVGYAIRSGLNGRRWGRVIYERTTTLESRVTCGFDHRAWL